MGKRSIWSFRTKTGRRHTVHTFIGLTIVFLLDYFTSDIVIRMFGAPEGSAQAMTRILYVSIMVIAAIWISALLNRDD